jgi:hypothetical protein
VSTRPQARRFPTLPAGWLILGICLLIAVAACRQGKPVFDPGPPNVRADGTISGTVRGPENSSSIEGRTVEVVNVETGERQKTATNNAGGFTFKVKPGKYRVTLTLLSGEVLIKQPQVIDVNRSDVDAHADFIVGSSRVMRPRGPRFRGDDGLGAPSA